MMKSPRTPHLSHFCRKLMLSVCLCVFGLLGLAQVGLAQVGLAHAQTHFALTEAEQNYLAEKKELRVCVDPHRMPFDGINEQGEHDGLSGDYFKNFARMMDVTMVRHPVESWEELMAAAKARDCDVVSQIVASEDRKAFLDFTSPYFILPLAVVTRYDRIFVEASLQGAGTKFAVIEGDIAIDKLKSRYPDVDLVLVPNNIAGLKKVDDGEVFGYIGAQGAVAFALQSNNFGKLSVTGSLPLSYDLSIATRNDEPLLGQVFEKAVQAVDPKEAQRIRNKWIAVSVERITDYTLLWQVLGVAGLLLVVSLWWNQRLAKANRTIKDTLDELHEAQALLETQNAHLKQQTITDTLTDVYNRLKLDAVLVSEIQRSNRTSDTFGVILMDIDHFKAINDTHGHQVGDDVLVAIGKVLSTSVRISDVVGRWGGEEFLICCPNTDLEGCRVLAEHIREAVQDHDYPNIDGLSASFGVVVHTDKETAQSLIARVDKALYRAKDLGRNRVELG